MSETSPANKAGWLALGEQLGAVSERWLALWLEIVRRYGENGRFYHTLDHIQHMLALLDGLPPAQDPLNLNLAVWLHDLVYDPRRSDNEEASARLAAQWLSPFLPPGQVQRISDLILATQHHRCWPDDADCALLLDADFAILGAETAVYEQYARAIRQEYVHVPDVAYRAGRTRVLEGFLERPFIYHTTVMRQRYEQKARQNIQAEIARLRQ